MYFFDGISKYCVSRQLLKNPDSGFNILNYVKLSSTGTRSSTFHRLSSFLFLSTFYHHYYQYQQLNSFKAIFWTHFLKNFQSNNYCS